MSPLSRFLLFLSIALVVIVAGLWISGGKKEEYSAKIEIDRRPGQIFPYLTDPEKLKNWMTGLEQVDQPLEPQDDYSTPPELMRTIVDPDGKRIEYQDLVIRFTENEILTIQSSAAGTVHTTILQLEKLDAQTTRFSYFLKVSHNSLARLAAPLKTSKLQDRITADVQKLKTLVEQNEPILPDEPESVAPPTEPAEGDADADDAEKPAPTPAESVPDVSGGGQ